MVTLSISSPNDYHYVTNAYEDLKVSLIGQGIGATAPKDGDHALRFEDIVFLTEAYAERMCAKDCNGTDKSKDKKYEVSRFLTVPTWIKSPFKVSSGIFVKPSELLSASSMTSYKDSILSRIDSSNPTAVVTLADSRYDALVKSRPELNTHRPSLRKIPLTPDYICALYEDLELFSRLAYDVNTIDPCVPSLPLGDPTGYTYRGSEKSEPYYDGDQWNFPSEQKWQHTSQNTISHPYRYEVSVSKLKKQLYVVKNGRYKASGGEVSSTAHAENEEWLNYSSSDDAFVSSHVCPAFNLYGEHRADGFLFFTVYVKVGFRCSGKLNITANRTVIFARPATLTQSKDGSPTVSVDLVNIPGSGENAWASFASRCCAVLKLPYYDSPDSLLGAVPAPESPEDLADVDPPSGGVGWEVSSAYTSGFYEITIFPAYPIKFVFDHKFNARVL